jgi:hypothetical protein
MRIIGYADTINTPKIPASIIVQLAGRATKSTTVTNWRCFP